MGALGRRRLSLATGYALLAGVGWRWHLRAAPVARAQSGASEGALDAGQAEAELLARLNACRGAVAQPALTADAGLMTLARWRSEDMAQTRDFSHDIGGRDVFDVMRERRLPFVRASENLAYNNLEPAGALALAMAELLASPAHRQTMLDPGFDRVGVGVGVACGAERRTYVTQLFVQSGQSGPAGQSA
jgi:uncharacterized protein YkwD